ncbi:MAG: tetratricopeptide repeat-containing protein [Isosphaeraceae bacterium]
MTNDPARSEEESIRLALEASQGDIGQLLDVLGRLIGLRRRNALALDLERELGRRLLGKGEPLLACGAVTGALRAQRAQPGDPRLRQLRGLALARMGETRLACRELGALAREHHDDPRLIEETFGILARTYKDLGFECRATDPARARKYWMRSFRHYNGAYAQTGSYYTGINAGTLSLLLGAPRKARALAERVLDHCLERWKAVERGDPSAGDDLYWLAATLGEAALILGQAREAARWYHEANRIGRRDRRFGDMGSTRRQLATILYPELRLDLSGLHDLFPMPKVAVFTGHMIDRPDRSRPRFPPLPAVEEQVKTAIRACLDQHDVLFGYASAACGSDILFLEAVSERGGETVIVLPYQKEHFCQDSVAILPGSSWSERFDKVLASSKAHTVSAHRLALQGISYEYANRFLHGLALTQAGQLESSVVHLAVWDQRPGDGPSGTADTIRLWRGQGHEVSVIDLEELLLPHQPLLASQKPALPVHSKPAKGIIRGSDLVAIFFADARGYSTLAEPDLPRFVEHFLGLIARQIDGLPQSDQPLKRNTWGDAVYLVLPDVRAAGRLALDIRDRLRETPWAMYDLPAGLTMRIGLHAGPACRCLDPVTKRDRFLGSHISLAARIEPIVSPGRVYTSQAFAILAAESGVTEFTCRYLGLKALPKHAGTVPVYALERSRNR